MSWGAPIVDGAVASAGDPAVASSGDPMVEIVVTLVFFVPIIAAGCRRLHDMGKSGWWQLLWFIPIIGWILLIVWLATNTKPEGDKYNQIEAS